jgi:hypothetical protein
MVKYGKNELSASSGIKYAPGRPPRGSVPRVPRRYRVSRAWAPHRQRGAPQPAGRTRARASPLRFACVPLNPVSGVRKPVGRVEKPFQPPDSISIFLISERYSVSTTYPQILATKLSNRRTSPASYHEHLLVTRSGARSIAAVQQGRSRTGSLIRAMRPSPGVSSFARLLLAFSPNRVWIAMSVYRRRTSVTSNAATNRAAKLVVPASTSRRELRPKLVYTTSARCTHYNIFQIKRRG